jgi:hypothetical protein
MINKVDLYNVTTKKSISISKDGESSLVLDSIEIEQPEITFETYRTPFQIGESQSSVTIGKRPVTITGYVIGPVKNSLGMSWEEYYSAQEVNIEAAKRNLNTFVSINKDLKLTFEGEYYLIGRPAGPIEYSDNESENNEVMCMFTIDLTCFFPMFRKGSGSSVDALFVENLFHFPLTIEENNFAFGEVLKGTRAVEINNTGDESCGMTITIIFNGDVSGFSYSIQNTTTDEELRIQFSENKTIKENSYIIINTNSGEEDIILHDSTTSEESSVVSAIDLSLDNIAFPKLVVGSNILIINDESECDTVIQYDELYYNISKM